MYMYGSQKRVSDTLNLELKTVGSHCVGAGNQAIFPAPKDFISFFKCFNFLNVLYFSVGSRGVGEGIQCLLMLELTISCEPLDMGTGDHA